MHGEFVNKFVSFLANALPSVSFIHRPYLHWSCLATMCFSSPLSSLSSLALSKIVSAHFACKISITLLPSPAVAIEAPEEGWFDFDRIHDELFEQGFTIYPGKPGAAPNFRLSVLGAIDQRDIKAFLRALEQVCLSARSGLSSP